MAVIPGTGIFLVSTPFESFGRLRTIGSLEQLIEFAAIEPYAAAARTGIDLDPIAFDGDQFFSGTAWAVHDQVSSSVGVAREALMAASHRAMLSALRVMRSARREWLLGASPSLERRAGVLAWVGWMR